VSEPTQARVPRQIPFIIANEGCERFSFYGMRNILTMFLATSLLLHMPDQAMRELEAKNIFHTFVIGVYFFPLLGGLLADKLFGKYNTILWFSLVYCAGHACLAVFEDEPNGFYLGLGLIALGSGGIKPLVATFMGDQFDQSNKHLAKVVFDAFYWIINFGSLWASMLAPWLLHGLGPAVAFGVPGVLMGIATLVFWLGRRRYVMLPLPPKNPHSFLRVVATALFGGTRGPGTGLALLGMVLGAASLGLVRWLELVPVICLALLAVLVLGGIGTWLQLDRARGSHPDDAVEGVRAVLRLLVVFALVTPFWSLFDQKASTWVLQANAMIKPSWFQSSHMQALNPLLVMLIIPFNNLVLWPHLRRLGREPSQLQKMTWGLVLAAAAWVAAGVMQLVLDGGTTYSIVWQVLPYFLLTFGEVLVSATGLEFAYSQAPLAMKGVIMSFWYLSVVFGNVWVLLANSSVKSPAVIERIAETGLSTPAFLMFFFAAFAFAAALAFKLYARTYKLADHYRAA
jgi:proton-dependent oligopeptide transporter, POT family